MVTIRLKELRKVNKKSQDEIAKLLNIERSSYSRYESGQRNLTADAIITLADFYKVSTDYLLGRTDDPNIEVVTIDDHITYEKRKGSQDLTAEQFEDILKRIETLEKELKDKN